MKPKPGAAVRHGVPEVAASHLSAGSLPPWVAETMARSQQSPAAQRPPAAAKAAYDAARQSMLRLLSPKPFVACQPQVASAAAARHADRLQLASTALAACPRQAAAAARLHTTLEDIALMRCTQNASLAHEAAAAVAVRQAPPEGFLIATADDLAALGLTAAMLSPEGSAARTAVYIKDPSVWMDGPGPAPVLAFWCPPSGAPDTGNGTQPDAPGYRNALQIGTLLAKRGADVHFVGHAAGGALARVAQLASGLAATIFEATGPDAETLARVATHLGRPTGVTGSMAAAGRVTAIRLEGGVLNRALLQPLEVGCTASGAPHPMRELIAAAGQSLKADEDLLRASFAPPAKTARAGAQGSPISGSIAT